MEGVGGGDRASAATLDQWRQFSRLFQFYLDKTTPHAVYRWIGTGALVFLYALRVYYVQGFYIVSYGLGIYILNLLIGFLSPLVDPELEPSDGPCYLRKDQMNSSLSSDGCLSSSSGMRSQRLSSYRS
ncbi:hypothetical protein OSB04_015750 [Centaurea solstitialis]|uniref:Uncharacterized protein n=1 Tax=Centaurea solstitialis TaxID=347529 RepID=A0AA38WGU1_9ASTR|nr:hypothetical protein OSB04_015750 [Centaurea solstitialis]